MYKEFKNESDIDHQRRLAKRQFPGLESYSGMFYAEVKKVHSGAMVHTRIKPVACCDIQLLDANLNVDRKHDVFVEIPLFRASRHIVDVPRAGDIVLLSFPYWQPHTAVIMGVLYDNQKVETTEGTVEIEGADIIKLGSAEDNAVLFAKLEEKLVAIVEDVVMEIGKKCALGGSCPGYPSAMVNWNSTIKPALDAFKSDIKVGATTKKA